MSVLETLPLLTIRRILTLIAGFIAAVLLAHFAVLFLQSLSPVPLGVGKWFPVSYGHPRIPSLVQIGSAVGTILGFYFALHLLERVPKPRQYFVATLIGILTILGTTAIQGIERGFIHPIAGREPHARPAQYWHDVQRQKIATGTDALRFLRDYQNRQPALEEHGRTHPPGAILFFALLRSVSGHRPGIAAVILCVIAISLVALGFYFVEVSPFALLLFCVLPAVQIYFCATLDAIIAGLLTVCILGNRRFAVTGIALLLTSFLTFGVVWVVPVLFAVEMARTRRLPWQTFVQLVVIILFYFVLYKGTGFNYLAAFRFASHNENPEGFRLLVNPVEYIATRFENITDIAFFASCFALWATGHGFLKARENNFPLWIAFVVGTITLLLLFLTGAYRTGETARACLFLYPLLTLIAAQAPLTERERVVFLMLILGNSALLQCIGFYFW